MKLSFSTLGCPDWPLDTILRRGAEYGYDGVAFRGLNGELDLTKVAEFQPDQRAATRRRMADAGLAANMVLSSARMMITDPAELETSQRLAEAHIDLAADLHSPAVRVFGGPILSGLSRVAAVERCAERLRRLGDHAARRGVDVLIETHDDWIYPSLISRAVAAADHKAVGILWDVHHPARIAEEPVAAAWEILRPWIRAVDIKDSAPDPAARLGYRYVKVGEGDIPLREALGLLAEGGYQGWLTFEWEKRWHPEIPEPEESFPAFTATMRRELASLK